MKTAATTLAICLALATPGLGAYPASDHPLFDGDAVHEIHFTFHQSNWWDLLVANFEGQADPIYLEGEFDWGTVHFDAVGIRFKGGSSYNSYPGQKKSFKVSFNEYDATQMFDGIDKLNFNNGFKDPSFVRERLAYEMCAAAGIPAGRTNFAKLFINGEYWGLYTLVEQVDGDFIEDRMGGDEDGNLWKGDPRGTLEYLGPAESSYYPFYELKTNETANDWSALVELTDGLNNGTLPDLPASVTPLMDLNSALALLAIDNLLVNLDSYSGRCANYYLYHRDLDDKFVFANWDLNESWGCFTMGMSVDQLKTLDPFWLPSQPGEQRPLASRLWQVSAYQDVYLGHMQKLMAGPADPDTVLTRMEDLRDLIRSDVYADTKKMYSNSQFDAAMTTDIGGGPGGVSPGLKPFIRGRDSYLRAQIGEWNAIEGLLINEVMASNDSTINDEHGEFDDWIEVVNVGSTSVNLQGLALTDDLSALDAYLFPAIVLDPGDHFLVWADDTPAQGNTHAAFKLNAGGDDIYLLDGAVILDTVTFGDQTADVSLGRCPDGADDWQYFTLPTPAADNGPCGANPQQFVVGEGLGQPNSNRVRGYDAAGLPNSVDFLAYAAGRWGVNVDAGDLDGDARAEILTGPGPGDVFGPQVRGFSSDGTALGKVNFYSYGTLKFGANVGSGLIDDDAFAEVLTGPGPGEVFGPHVRAFNYDGSGIAAVAKVNFFAFGTLKFGVNVTEAELDADGFDEILTGAGPGVIFGAQARGWNFDGDRVTSLARVNFAAYGSKYGVNLAGADADGDGYAELATAPGPGPSNPGQYRGFDYDDTSITSLPGFDTTPFTTLFGARAALGDVDGGGVADLLAGAGPDPAADSTVLCFSYDGSALDQLPQTFVPFGSDGYGVNVAAGGLGY